MTKNLDIAPLRSFVAIADCGGFQRAATHLHLTQGAVSQHVRRLEDAVGRQLVQRHGRGSRFTPDGDELLAVARQILDLHDNALRSFGVRSGNILTIGSTEHGAAQLLPALASALGQAAPQFSVRFRIDRGGALRDGLARRRIDLALLLNSDDPSAIRVGDLELTWYSAPGWQLPPRPDPVPIVAFDSPCALRSRALETLSEVDLPASIRAEAPQLGGVHAAVATGVGVALLATLGQTPEGLVPCFDLPAAKPLRLSVGARPGLPVATVKTAADALRPLLAPPLRLAAGA
ncbi:LysR family transcriptional regulator [Nocardia nova]|uniref:LysR family transcriptional regulator n=1 Tax=Nocardia nova TaxID=37330 RepID=A0A2S6AJF1_9NOCA|nr:LysR family transcriptional regulator [Nocardia nova]PPJ22614.1 LysR family transcriptional regulator [Nocardia nova]PPJ35352.1 LysR family transcriptional regulator [Nocardia nova]